MKILVKRYLGCTVKVFFLLRYLILSDIDRNLVYVLSLEVSTEEKAMNASVVSVSEFTTPSSFLSFCCSSAGRRQVILCTKCFPLV
jgi:hypothetical protein